MSTAVALILLFVITTYAVFAGADFGAGFWDLIAGNPTRGEEPRAQIEHSIGPVWEANHVWLIFALVVLWSGFPIAFQSIMLTLFVPITLAALGVVLRGASFAFRKSVVRLKYRRAFGAGFALSSVLVPYFFGAVAGAIASGRVPSGGKSGDLWSSWINPTSVVVGLLAIATCAFLAATFLIWDSKRLGNGEMQEYFRKRAFGASLIAGLVAFCGIFVLHSDSPYLFHGLLSRGLPLVVLSIVCGITSLVLLHRRAARGARQMAIGAVATIVVGWGIAQWPYLLPTSTKVTQAAAPDGTLEALVGAFIIAAVMVVPSIALLYILDQKTLLPSEGKG